MRITLGLIHLLFLGLVLTACGGRVYAPVESPGEPSKSASAAALVKRVAPDGTTPVPAQHIVARGDTLYSIAFNYGFDYREIAAWNNIRSPYTIYPGQRLLLRAPSIASASEAQPGPASRKQPHSRQPEQPQPLIQEPIVRKKPDGSAVTSTTKPAETSAPQVAKSTAPEHKPVSAPKAPLPSGAIQWNWPTQGKVITSNTPISKNGVDIAGVKGQPIHAAAGGDVVYSGSGLLGYGRLIIIKHNDQFLSAYAHNDELLVKEGERVTAGQQIARMGQTTNGRTLLHFEIRKNGQPVNPLSYLPRQ